MGVEREDGDIVRVSIQFPLVLPSVANAREHWTKRARRTAAQRNAVRLTAGGQYRGFVLPMVVKLTRIAPRKLDSDNLSSSFKAIRDQVADELGVNDGDARIAWLYAQESGAAAVRIEVESV